MRNAALAALAILLVAPATPAHADNSSNEVLIIPLSGKLRGKLRPAPKRFTKALAKLAETSTGSRSVAARVAKSDITTLVGCREESEACYAEVAATLGVDELIFGKVARQPDGTLEVTLTRVRPNSSRKARTRTFTLQAGSLGRAQTEFETKAAKFLAEKDDAPDPPDKPDKPIKVPEPEPTGDGFAWKRVKGYTWAMTIGGGAAMLLGGALLAMASSKQSDVDDAATDSVDDLNRLEDLESTGKTLSLFGNSFVIAGAVATIAGAYLMYKQGSAKTEERAISIGPTDRGSGFAVTLSGRF